MDDPDIFYALTLFLLLLCAWLVVPAYIADRKGYFAGDWFFACGFVGAVWLLFLPDVYHRAEGSEQVRQLKDRARRLGRILTTIQAIPTILWIGYEHYFHPSVRW